MSAVRQLAAPDRQQLDEQCRDRARSDRPIAFGAFLAAPGSRTLFLKGMPVEIGSRAFDLLIVLLRARGEIVEKEEIVRQVWPTTTVDESNLRFQMACLRKALGPERGRIKTIAGRGYMFAADGDASSGTPAWQGRSAIVIIDADPEKRAALHRLLRPFDAHVESFGSLAAFLESGTTAACGQ